MTAQFPYCIKMASNYGWIPILDNPMAIIVPLGYFEVFSKSAAKNPLYVRIFNTFPTFHAAGVYFGLVNAVCDRSVAIYPIAGFPSASLLIDGLKHNKADVAVLVPPYVINITQNADSLDFIAANLKRIFYMGGRYSSTVWNRNTNPEKVQPVFKIFPTLQRWGSKDLYSPHPTNQDLWLYRGRGDDIIVFLTSEKTNPISMEHSLNQQPEIRQAMVVGTLRFQAALLIELAEQKTMSATGGAETIERTRLAIEEANAICPAHARVAKSHILFTEPGRPILMSAKGTIKRAPTLREYSSEIEKLYLDADRMSAYASGDNDENAEDFDMHNTNAVRDILRQAVLKVAKWDDARMQDEDNLFVQGMDSLQALQLIRHLRKALNKHDLTITILYTNPSIAQLSESLSLFLSKSLDDETYKRIQGSVTGVIHSAWPVNFNLSLDTFKPQLEGIANLLSFISAVPHHISLLFISSISSILGLESTAVPEKIINDTSAPLPMGYAESKFISERILDYASKTMSNVDVKVARVGQTAGPAYASGVWNKYEWMPSLVITSFNMGFIPENLGSDKMKLDWVPIDILSSSLVDISFNNDPKTSHSDARTLTTWNILLPIILKTSNASSTDAHAAVTTIPYTAWLQKLRDTAREYALSKTMDLAKILAKYPAIKLLEFFETLPETKWSDKEVNEALKASSHLANLSGIEWAWMEKWVKGWI
ncbi:hypothetical protein EAF04_005154 [Stromatinia cepivora]|nr:hypothetical protein EAF04_005154 [Stromatinia cepivora]